VSTEFRNKVVVRRRVMAMEDELGEVHPDVAPAAGKRTLVGTAVGADHRDGDVVGCCGGACRGNH
jgi:hypothetical protein